MDGRREEIKGGGVAATCRGNLAKYGFKITNVWEMCVELGTLCFNVNFYSLQSVISIYNNIKRQAAVPCRLADRRSWAFQTGFHACSGTLLGHFIGS